MKKGLLVALLLLQGCGYLPSINPTPTVTVTVTATPTPETTKAIVTPSTIPRTQTPPKAPIGKITHQIRFDGKKGTKVSAGYVIMDLKNPMKTEQVEGVLPFTVDLDMPSDAVVSAYLNPYGLTDEVNPKVFIYRKGIDCGKVAVVGSAVKYPEASKVCGPEQ